MKRRLFWKICIVLLVSVVFTFNSGSQAAAKSVADFYKGKIIRYIVPFSPGGGYDTYSRLLAATLEKRLKCTVVVINKPGAGGMVAINSFYQSARKDGLTLAIAPEGLPLAQAIGSVGVRYDSRKFGWIGSVNQEIRFILVGLDSPYKTVDDLKKLKQPKGGVTTVTGPAGPATIIALEVLDMKNAKVIAGYPGSTELILAVKRGEVHFTGQSINHILKKDPLLRPLAVIDQKRAPQFPDVPAFTESGVKPEAKRMMEIVNYGKPAGRCVITPPGVSREKIDFLRKVVADAYRDPEFLKRAKKMGLLVHPMSGKDAEVGVAKTLGAPPEEIKKLKYILTEKYLR